MLVQAAGQHVRSGEDRDARLVEVALYGGRGHAVPVLRAGALEADLVVGLGVGDVDLPAHRVHSHIEEDRTDMGVLGGGDLGGRRRRGVDREHVEIGQAAHEQAV